MGECWDPRVYHNVSSDKVLLEPFADADHVADANKKKVLIQRCAGTSAPSGTTGVDMGPLQVLISLQKRVVKRKDEGSI